MTKMYKDLYVKELCEKYHIRNRLVNLATTTKIKDATNQIVDLQIFIENLIKLGIEKGYIEGLQRTIDTFEGVCK